MASTRSVEVVVTDRAVMGGASGGEGSRWRRAAHHTRAGRGVVAAAVLGACVTAPALGALALAPGLLGGCGDDSAGGHQGGTTGTGGVAGTAGGAEAGSGGTGGGGAAGGGGDGGTAGEAGAGGEAGGAPGLDPIMVEGARILDQSGREVVLRGMVVISSITSTPSSCDFAPVTLAPGDFEQMRQWGMDAQVIRLDACKLGFAPDPAEDASCKLDPGYLDLVEDWVDLAEQVGMYSIFKLTTYAVPSWCAAGPHERTRWQQFWDNVNGEKDLHLGTWKPVFERFAGRVAVVGYDVLNEPVGGTKLATKGQSLVDKYLNPYYAEASSLLRSFDATQALVFQHPVLEPAVATPPKPATDPHPLYAPHAYPVCSKSNPPDLDALYANEMKSWHAAAEKIAAAWLIGEYEFPNTAIDFPPTDLQFPAWSVASGQASAAALDHYGRGWFRPWYAHSNYWGVLDEQGQGQPEKVDILSRPYPRRVAGHPDTPGTDAGWQYEFDTKVLQLAIEPADGVTAPTEIFVPAARHYPGGFLLTLDGKAYASDPAAPDGLTPPAAGASFDFDAEILSGEASAATITITIAPASEG